MARSEHEEVRNRIAPAPDACGSQEEIRKILLAGACPAALTGSAAAKCPYDEISQSLRRQQESLNNQIDSAEKNKRPVTSFPFLRSTSS